MIDLLIDIPSLKLSARNRMQTTKPSVYGVTAIYLVIALITSTLTFVLSGASETYRRALEYISMHDYITYSQFYTLRPNVTVFASILVLALSIAMIFVNVGYSIYCLKVSRRNMATFKDLFNGFEDFGRVILIALLEAVFIWLWSLLFVIPGIIAAYRYRMAFYVMYDHPEFSAIECIRESKRLMTGNKGKLFLTDLSFIGLAVADYLVQLITAALFTVSLPIVSIYLSPYHGITIATFYNALLISDGQTINESVKSGTQKKQDDPWDNSSK